MNPATPKVAPPVAGMRTIVRRKKGREGHHGGAWKVAYADFITALMALFLLLWLVGSASDEQKKAIAGYFRDDPIALPGESSPGVGILEGETHLAAIAMQDSLALEHTLVALNHTFHEGVPGGIGDQVLAEVTDEGLRIDLVDRASDVLFDMGSSEIRPAAAGVLEEIARLLAPLPNRVVIGGHTDSRPYTDRRFSNWELSTQRANRARQIMAVAGLEESRLALVAGYADTRPLVAEDPASPKNRRISITVLRQNPGTSRPGWQENLKSETGAEPDLDREAASEH